MFKFLGIMIPNFGLGKIWFMTLWLIKCVIRYHSSGMKEPYIPVSKILDNHPLEWDGMVTLSRENSSEFWFQKVKSILSCSQKSSEVTKKILAIHTFFWLSNKLFSIRLFAHKSLFDICILGTVHLLRNTISGLFRPPPPPLSQCVSIWLTPPYPPYGVINGWNFITS